MGHNAPPPRPVGVVLAAFIIGFLCGSAFNYYVGAFLGTHTQLRYYSWNIPSEQRVFVATFWFYVLVAALLNILAIRRVVGREVGIKDGLFLGFAFSFPAYLLLGIFLFLSG
jgi:hypothetical protein